MLNVNLFQKWYFKLPHVFYHFLQEEVGRKTLLQTLQLSLKSRKLKFSETENMASLLEKWACAYPSKPFLYFENEKYTFRKLNNMTNQVAHFLDELGYRNGDGVGIMLENSPEFLAVYFATQRKGMYAVPINLSLIGEGLLHILKDSRIQALFIEERLLKVLKPVLSKLSQIKHIIVCNEKSLQKKKRSSRYIDMKTVWRHSKQKKQKWRVREKDISTILYTSGTTGQPKGVVYTYNSDWLRKAGLINHLIYNKNDVLYTCLPLFHANALFLSLSAALWLGIPLVLSRKFSASHFWEEIKRNQATVFNAIGAMIPILLKNPQRAEESNNSVRLVLSAACPADYWKDFEKRFAVKIWEGYSAVDGGQNFIFNFGNAPVGSIGKMSLSKYRIVDDKGKDVKANVVGELIFKVGKNQNVLKYFQNQKATNEKIKDNYLYTGDLVYKDKKGYLYFVGRKTENMRRRGENVSAYEVESVILKHKGVLECAAFGVPSELGEEDIMCVLVPVDGHKIDPYDLHAWLKDKLARHAIPRYFRVMTELPKTPTHRVIKQSLKEAGVTSDTYDLEGPKRVEKKRA